VAPAVPAGVTGGPGARRRPAADVAVPTALAATVLVVLAVLHRLLTRPLWYDESWRPHFLAEPPSAYWGELAHANTPSALGWAVLTRLVGDAAGWHALALRIPELAALVALPAVAYAFTRRFAGPVAAGLGAASLGLSGVLVDLGTQLKPYSVEALASLVIVQLWSAAPGTAPWHRRIAWRTAAGLVSLFSVPAAFLVIPLAAVDVVSAGYGYRYGSWRVGWRHRLWAAGTALPAVVLCGLHTALFVGHQSSQRASQFWDSQFLAGRGPLDGLRFVATEMVHTFGGTPTGVDRYDPNLVHPLTDPTVAAWLLAPAAAIAFAAGAITLARGCQGIHITGNARRLLDQRADAGRYPLAATLGGLALALIASAGRYWPFGANRTNTFLVPLLLTVVAVGADRLARRAVGPGAPLAGLARAVGRIPPLGRIGFFRREPADGSAGAGRPGAFRGTPGGRSRRYGAARRAPAAAIRVVLAVVVVVLAAAPVASASALRPLWRERAEIRPVALMVDATTLTRRIYRPGDVVMVGGRLARPGWLYAMDVSDDGPYLAPPAAPGIPAPVGARVPTSSTVFLAKVGTGEARTALTTRRGPRPTRILLFVLDYDRSGTWAELADLGGAGYCPSQSFDFPRTGTLHILNQCPPPTDR
jgi:hypothetical protein